MSGDAAGSSGITRGILQEVVALSIAFCLIGSMASIAPADAAGLPAELDTTFGTNGWAVVPFDGGANAASFDLRADGRIVMAGSASLSSPDLNAGIARVNGDGSIDSTFGTNGASEVDMGGSDYANDSLLQSDGKIVLAGRTSIEGGEFALARTSATGALDPTFGSNGRVYLHFPGEFGATAIAQQVDEKIVVVGETSSAADGTAGDFAIARLNTNGSLDTTFGTAGIIQVGFGGKESARSVAVQADGKILVGGHSTADGGEMVLTRLLPEGKIDTSFGADGRVFHGSASSSSGHGIELLSGGKILVAATEIYAKGQRFSILRLNGDGTLDTSFGVDGRSSVEFEMSFNGTPMGIAIARTLAVQRDGKILVGGYRSDPNAHFTSSAALARLDASGAIDTTFGDQGKAVFGRCDVITDVGVQPDGKLLATGDWCGPPNGFTVFRLNGDAATAPPPPGDQAPSAAFYHSPTTPNIGQWTTFTDISSDPDGDIVAVAWDLDGDAAFDDATGSRVSWTFETGGTHHVGVRVTDDDGATATTTQALNVTSRPRNISPPQILRSPGLEGSVFHCTTGEWAELGADPRFEYVWRRGTKDIKQFSGYVWDVAGTESTYLLKDSDVGATFTCEVKATNEEGQTSAFSDYVVLTAGDLDPFKRGKPYGNFRIRGIDVFQTVQPNSRAPMFGYPEGRFPRYCGGGTPTSYRLPSCDRQGPTQRVLYEGVSLDVHKRTSAIVYVDMETDAATDGSRRIEVSLTPRVDGKLLSNLSVTKTVTSPPVSQTPWVTTAERGDTRYGVEFPVPQLWLGLGSRGRLDLVARSRFPSASLMELRTPYQCENAERNCTGDDSFRLDDLLIYRMPVLQIETVLLNSKDGENLSDADQVLRRAAEVFPGGDQWSFPSTRSTLDIREIAGWTLDSKPCQDIKAKSQRKCHQSWISQNLLAFTAQPGTDVVLAVHDYQTSNEAGRTFLEPGWKLGGTPTLEAMGSPTWSDLGPTRARPIMTANAGSAQRPLSAAAHEMGHAIASPHAGQDCEGTGVGEDQEGEAWPGDDQGRLQGVKFDAAFKRSEATGRIVPWIDGSTEFDGDPLLEPPLKLFDLMSYCADGDDDSWISPRNWNRFFDTVRTYGQRFANLRTSPPERTASANRSVAIGVAGPGGGVITRLIPGIDAAVAPESVPGSPLRLRALGEDGAVLEEVGIEIVTSTEGAPDEGAFVGAIPSSAVAVELLQNGQVLHRIDRSAAPTVKFITPGKETFVKAGDDLVVRWSSSDPDQDDLTATVDFSANGGRRWRTVFEGQDEGRAVIPGRHLERSDRARIRVRLNDGFTQTAASSPLFETQGAPPQAQIISPPSGQSLRVREKTVLSGAAVDDRGRMIAGSRLAWFAGGKKLGTGKEIAARLPVGKVTLKLVARDVHGRKGVARRTVTVRALPLQVTQLKAPERVRAGARAFVLKIAASGPARLVAGGRSFRIGKNVRSIEIPLPRRPKRGLLEIPFELTPRNRAFRGKVRANIAFIRG